MGQLRNTRLLKNIALVLKQLRDNAGLTQDEVYDETKIHVGRIETAKANLSVSTLAALCKYYKISLSEFYKRVENL
jgi:transcriptional regulator with XRE-family HTH domain